MQATLSILSCPYFVPTSSSFEVQFSITNTGTEILPFSGPNPIRIGSQTPQDNFIWGTNRISLSQDIKPNQTVTVVTNLTSPYISNIADITKRNFNFFWQLLQEGITWFGNIVNQIITIPILNQFPENPNNGSIVGTIIANTGPFPTGGTKTFNWIYKGNSQFSVLISQVWAGLDPDRRCDMYCGMTTPNGTLLGWLPLDRYSNPSTPDINSVYFPTPGVILNPNDVCEISTLSNPDIPTQAAYAIALYGKYL